MHVNYCTLFDSNYLDRGLAMYNSLNRVCEDYSLYIFAFNREAYEILSKKNLPNVFVLEEDDLLDEQSKEARENRSRAEWCWTCSALSIDYLLNRYKLDNCVYIDSDLYFFSDPNVLVQEMIDHNKSVLITNHRLNPGIENRIIKHMYGTYCVQFNVFMNDANAKEILAWWKDKCLKDCSGNRTYEVYGDQKYQNEFPKRFRGVHVMENEGGGLAPWNISQYKMLTNENGLQIINKRTKKKVKAIFYHYHGFEILSNDLINMSVYRWKGRGNDEKLLKVIYGNYFRELQDIRNELNKAGISLVKQTEKIREVKAQKKKDCSAKRRIGQIVVGILSLYRTVFISKKDFVHVNLWAEKVNDYKTLL